jgi:hypothetical protein
MLACIHLQRHAAQYNRELQAVDITVGAIHKISHSIQFAWVFAIYGRGSEISTKGPGSLLTILKSNPDDVHGVSIFKSVIHFRRSSSDASLFIIQELTQTVSLVKLKLGKIEFNFF